LGAGGLVRAYSSSAAENLDGADIRVLEMCQEYVITVDYTGIDGVQKYLSSHACSLLSTDYGEKVSFTVAVKKAAGEAFIDGLVDYMQGRISHEKGKEYYAPFKE
jgi:putative IMPACT (imprinted ancient) family translation regulator